MKRRVLQATTSYPSVVNPSAGIFVRRVVEAQRALGWSVGVVSAPGLPTGVRDSLSNVRRLPAGLVAVVLLYLRIVRHARSASVIHAHWWPTAFMALLAGSKCVVVTLHGSDVLLLRRAPLRWFGAWTLRRCTMTVAVSRHLATQTERFTGVPVDAVVQHGDDVEAVPRLSEVRSGVVFVGRLAREKGAADLPDIVRAMRRRGVTDTVRVLGDGPLRHHIERELAAEIAAGTVVLIGSVPHAVVRDELYRSAVMICPSYAEGFGLACAEAINRAVAVVAYRTGGLIEQLENRAGGTLVEVGDVVTMAGEVATLLEVARPPVIPDGGRSWTDAAMDYLALYELAAARGQQRRTSGGEEQVSIPIPPKDRDRRRAIRS